MKTILISLIAFSLVLFGCIQSQQPNGQTSNITGEVLQPETNDLSDGLDDFLDLQNSLDDSALADSEIDENAFS